jgi:hypothetical protein
MDVPAVLVEFVLPGFGEWPEIATFTTLERAPHYFASMECIIMSIQLLESAERLTTALFLRASKYGLCVISIHPADRGFWKCYSDILAPFVIIPSMGVGFEWSEM